MKYSNKLVYTILVVLTFTVVIISCSENPLEEEIYSFNSKDNFYQSEADAEAAISSVYSGAASNNVYGRWFYDLVHLFDDQSTIHRNPTFIQMDEFNLPTNHPFVEALWSGIYSTINRANVAISRIPDIEQLSQNEINSLVAEARFLRATMYFHLVRMWGSVPLSVEEVQDDESANLPMEPADEIYNVILEDLRFAEQHLPASRPATQFGRVVNGAAKAALADVYLTRENWSLAAEKTKEIIDSGNYSLVENFEAIFSEDNENNSEIIYSIIYDGVNDGNWMASFSHAGGGANPNAFLGVQVWQVEQNSDMWLNWDDNDPRKGFTTYTKFVSKSGDTVDVLESSRPYPAFGKWNAPNETGLASCPLNPIIYRYADVLLMHAEAISQSIGPNQDAYEVFNKVRRRGYGEPINQPSSVDLTPGLDAQSFRDSVIVERSYEFVIEGKRLFDLLRTSQFPQILEGLGKDVKAGASHLPIPQSEIDANDNLTAGDQNAGY